MNASNTNANLNGLTGSLMKSLMAIALICIFTNAPGQVAGSLLSAATPKVSLS